MYSIQSKNFKNFHRKLLEHIEFYKYVKVWYTNNTYHARLTYHSERGCIPVPIGNRFFKIGAMLHSLGYKEGDMVSQLGKLIKGRNDGQIGQNERCIQPRLF
jgi:hypothetical protein